METAVRLTVGLAVLLGLYVLKGLGLRRLVRRRDVDGGWMAWVPVLDTVLLARLADRHRRKDGLVGVTAGLLVGIGLLLAAVGVCALVTAVRAARYTETMLLFGMGIIPEGFLAPVLIIRALLAVAAVTAAVLLVVRHMASYQVFASCGAGNKGYCTALCAVFPPILGSLLFFGCREDAPEPAEE